MYEYNFQCIFSWAKSSKDLHIGHDMHAHMHYMCSNVRGIEMMVKHQPDYELITLTCWSPSWVN